MIRSFSLGFVLLGLSACQKAPPAAPSPAQPPTEEVSFAPDPAIFEAEPPLDWRAPLDRDHPWVGRIWDTGAEEWITPQALIDALGQAEVVLLGELHDHPDHHRLQAWILAQLATPAHAVVFEQLHTAQPIEARSPAELAHRSGWASSGWPDFALYAPIFESIYAAEAQIIAGHPTREQVRLSMTEGLDALPTEVTADLPLRPLPPALHADLVAQIVDSHCGWIEADGAGPMVTAQTFKDAHMARALIEAGAPAVLIAGNGHVRTDRGVPHYLDLDTAAVILHEVSGPSPETELPEPAPADFIWFTPRRHDEDPCDRFR